eukprot:779630-Rhodomonas_salina.1
MGFDPDCMCGPRLWGRRLDQVLQHWAEAVVVRGRQEQLVLLCAKSLEQGLSVAPPPQFLVLVCSLLSAQPPLPPGMCQHVPPPDTKHEAAGKVCCQEKEQDATLQTEEVKASDTSAEGSAAETKSDCDSVDWEEAADQ